MTSTQFVFAASNSEPKRQQRVKKENKKKKKLKILQIAGSLMAFSMTKAGVLLDPWSYCCIYLLQFSTYFVTIVLFVKRKRKNTISAVF